jgi:hypothetical protein
VSNVTPLSQRYAKRVSLLVCGLAYSDGVTTTIFSFRLVALAFLSFTLTFSLATTSTATAVPTSVHVNDPQQWKTGDPTFAAPAATPKNVGVNYHGMWSDLSDSERKLYLDRLTDAGIKWVRLDVAWAMVQPNGPKSYDMQFGVPEVDKRVNELHSRGIKTLMLFHWAPKWSSGTRNKNGVPRDANEFGRAAAWVADRYRGKVQAMELLNEPDQPQFLADTSVATYTRLLKAAYPRIKAVNQGIKVVAGAPTYVRTGWYKQMYELGGGGNFDALGIHPYMGLADKEPSYCDSSPNHIKYNPCNIPNLVKLMEANGDGNKTIWSTEYGWSNHDNSTYGSNVPNWRLGVTRKKQAQYLIQMQEVLSQWPQVEASFWYTGRDSNSGDAQYDYYGLMYRNLARKPAYYAMKCVSTGICSPPSATPADFVYSGDSWQFSDTGQDLGTGWRAANYNDSTWKSGRTMAGFGQGGEATRLSFGSDSQNKPITTYARTKFEAGGSTNQIGSLTLRARIDDGAAVYLNGQQIWRFNLPGGTLTNTTRATRYVAGAEENTWRTKTIPASALNDGTNTLAVEVHQHDPASSDLIMDVELAPVG